MNKNILLQEIYFIYSCILMQEPPELLKVYNERNLQTQKESLLFYLKMQENEKTHSNSIFENIRSNYILESNAI